MLLWAKKVKYLAKYASTFRGKPVTITTFSTQEPAAGNYKNYFKNALIVRKGSDCVHFWMSTVPPSWIAIN